jgi:hypothetical protein
MVRSITHLMGMILLLVAAQSASAVTIFVHEYRIDGTARLLTVETDTGVETEIGTTGIDRAGGMTFDPSGTLYVVDRSDEAILYSVDPATAVATALGATSINNRPAQGLTFGLDGTLYGSGGGFLFRIDPATGAATNLGSIGAADVDGLTVAPVDVDTAVGTFPAGTLIALDSTRLYAIDPVTLTTVLIGFGVSATESITFSGDGRLFGHDFGGLTLYEIDPLQLSATPVATTSSAIPAIASPTLFGAPANAPEPAVALLLAAAILALRASPKRLGR